MRSVNNAVKIIMFSDLEKSILKTISYFDIFSFPLTPWEIKKNLYQPDQPYSFVQIEQALVTLLQTNFLGNEEGFYFLKGRNETVQTRKRRYLLAKQKVRRAKFLIKLISMLPFIKAIFICNDVAYQNAPDDSDIDLAIITSANRIWSARFFSTTLMKLLAKRPTPRKRKDRICLSFYFTENNLNLHPLAYENDIHFSYWISQFVPVYGKTELIARFFQANSWIKNYLPGFVFKAPPVIARLRLSFGEASEKVLGDEAISERTRETKMAPLELLLKKIQLRVLPERLKQLAQENNTNVVISDTILKFHDKDNRIDILQRWKDKIEYLH